MTYYRCYFVQKDGFPAASRSFESESDGEAQDYTLGLLVGFPHADRVEVWADPRLILNCSRSTTRTPAEMHRLRHLAIAAARKETDPKIRQTIASCAASLAQEAEASARPCE